MRPVREQYVNEKAGAWVEKCYDLGMNPNETAFSKPLSQRADLANADYLSSLNPPQREAVETLEGAVLMLAGAGTGKTKALTARIAHLLHTRTAKPGEILTVTFTNKAAREIKTRVGDLLGQVVEGMPWLGTFHAICVKLLRRHAELVGLKSNFTILDTDDQLRLLRQLIQAENIDEKRWPPRYLAAIINGWKNRAWTPDNLPLSEASAFNHKGPSLYRTYQERLQTLNACDFGDLLLHMLNILQDNPSILEFYQKRFRYILVDEYQDTNVAQYLWLRLLAAQHHNICCVGDDDQSIYGWRGAEVENILRFEKDFTGAKVIRLEQNYRSTRHILGAASGVIAANEARLGKKLWTDLPSGEKLRLIGHWDGEEEARWIGEEIEALSNGTRGLERQSLEDVAILVRASHQMRAFEDRFLMIGLPYRVIGGPRFYERLEIRDAIAYFRLCVSGDDGLAFERIINTPKRGIGEKAQQIIFRMARDAQISPLEAARRSIDQKLLSSRALSELRKFIENIDQWSERVRAGENHVRLAEEILDGSGCTNFWLNNKSPDAAGRLENLKELIKALEEFENFQGFLEHVSLIMENESDDYQPKTSIMTLHASKGLEFPVVFLPGWEDGLFPSQRAMDENGRLGIEEERRLAYVGITRARKLCTISFAANRRVYGNWQSSFPSRFIDELPEEHVDVLTPPGLYMGSQNAASFDNLRETSDLLIGAAKADVYNSPGWKRLQERRDRGPKTETSMMSPKSDQGAPLNLGARVFHQKFGYGIIEKLEGDRVNVAFEKAGDKHVMAQYLTLV